MSSAETDDDNIISSSNSGGGGGGGGFPQLQAEAGVPAPTPDSLNVLGNYRMTPMEAAWARNTRETILEYSGAGSAVGIAVIAGVTVAARKPTSPVLKGLLVLSGGMLGAVAGSLQSANVWFPKLLALGEASPLARKAAEVAEANGMIGPTS